MVKLEFDVTPKLGKANLLSFQALNEINLWAREVAPIDPKSLESKDPFYNGHSFVSGCNLVATPRPDLAKMVADAERKLGKLPFQSRKREQILSVVGRPRVPLAIAGHPTPMVRTVEENSPNAALSVVVNLSVSMSVAVEEIEMHGIYLCAALKRIAAYRPITLHFMGGASHYRHKSTTGLWTVKVNATPFDVNRLAGLMSDAGFVRGFGHKANIYSSSGGEAKDYSRGDLGIAYSFGVFEESEYWQAFIHQKFGRSVMYLGARHLCDATFRELRNDPVAWVNELVERARQIE